MPKYIEALEVEKYIEEMFTDDCRLQAIKNFITPIIENEKNKKAKRDLGLKYSYKDFTTAKEVSKIINALNNSVLFHKQAKEDLRILDERTQDILHALELTSIRDEVSDSELLDRLTEVRRERRTIKDFLETLEPLKEYATNNKDSLDDFKKLQGSVSKIHTALNERKYYVRAEKQLKSVFN